jgi:hypothetical protein
MKRSLTLADRIKKEVEELNHVVERCLNIWQQAEISGDDRYIDGVALNLHSFYTGLERIFELISAEVDRTLPTGPNWHQELLRRAATPIPNLRPAVISDAIRNRLDRYRGFRHVVRNIYAFEIDRELVAPLLHDLPELFAGLRAELTEFANALPLRNSENDANASTAAD